MLLPSEVLHKLDQAFQLRQRRVQVLLEVAQEEVLALCVVDIFDDVRKMFREVIEQ